MGVLLGVDWGRARVGVAASDESGLLAHPLTTLRGNVPAALASEIARLAEERKAQTVVLGWPLHMNGQEGDSAQEVRKLAAALESQGLTVVLRDERLSSWAVDQMWNETPRKNKRPKGDRDAAAAALILQGHLDQQRNKT